MEMKTIVSNDYFELKSTGRDYDFVAVIENKTEWTLAITPEDYDEPAFYIDPYDWIGLLACDEGYYIWEMIEAGKYEFETLTEDEMAEILAA